MDDDDVHSVYTGLTHTQGDVRERCGLSGPSSQITADVTDSSARHGNAGRPFSWMRQPPTSTHPGSRMKAQQHAPGSWSTAKLGCSNR